MNFYEMLTEAKGSAPIFGDMFSFNEDSRLCVFEDDKAWCNSSFPQGFEGMVGVGCPWPLKNRGWEGPDQDHFGPVEYMCNLRRPSWEDV